ncbi:hypothetical protein MHJ82_10575 [Corynebacterium afermentans]|uniref:hypothetical protein n=1 Tax=Corynebacterium afermentans TaxID=38286 RepID=UPI002573DEEB|nr:hypothetical protein [Corynebacterium afermentans]MCG7274748.1 hypothetical protein [Corynebacterium afermentans]
MASNSKVNRIAGLSLAAAVAGTMTLVPVAKAETTSPSSEATTSKAPVVSTTDTGSAAPATSSAASATSSTASATSSTVAPATTSSETAAGTPKASTSKVAPTTKADTTQEWADILKGFASLIVSATAAGSGTSGVQYSSDDHTYSAVASNPTNGRLYAVSDKGNLLRIHPQTGNLKDLGEIPGFDAEEITSAAFTKDGTLVLFDGETVYTKDLADDETGPTSKPANLDFVKKPVDGVLDLPKLAWAPTDNDAELVALATEDGKATRYTLNVKDAKATADEAPAKVDESVNLDDVAAFEYAYLADEATFFADGEGNAVKLEDGKIVAVETDRTEEDNYKAVAGLEAKPQSAADSATVTPTTNAEPSPSKKAPSVGQRDAEVVELDVEVVTDDGRSVQGVSFVSKDGTVDGSTDETGKGKVSLKLDDASRGKDTFNLAIAEAPEGWGGSVAEVQRGAKSVKFVLPKGENASATTTVAAPKDTPTSTTTTKKTESKDNFFEVEVLVKTADDKLVEGAEFKSEDGRVVGTTDANGRGRIGIDLKKNSRDNNLIQLALKEAPKGYKNTEVLIRRDEDKAELVLPRDPNATPSSTLSKPDQVLKVIDQVRPMASSFLAPAAALAGAGGLAGAAGLGGAKSTKSTKTTFGGTKVTSSKTTGRSTGRSTSVKPSAKVVTRSGNSTKVAKSTSTSTTSSDKERDGDLADTGTPMRAIIALGVLSVLIGGAYLALGRRRENQ